MTFARRTWEPGPRALQCYTLNLRSIASTNLWLNPTPLRRAETAFSPGLSQLLRTIQRGLEGATHRHSRKPRVQHACKLVLPSGGVNQAPARHGGPFHRRSTAHRFERARLHSGSRAGYRSQSAPRQAGNGLTGQGGSRNMSFASRLRYWVRVSSRRFPIPRSSPTRVPRRRQSAGPVSGDIPMRTLAAFLTPPVAGAGADGSAGETA